MRDEQHPRRTDRAQGRHFMLHMLEPRYPLRSDRTGPDIFDVIAKSEPGTVLELQAILKAVAMKDNKGIGVNPIMQGRELGLHPDHMSRYGIDLTEVNDSTRALFQEDLRFAMADSSSVPDVWSPDYALGHMECEKDDSPTDSDLQDETEQEETGSDSSEVYRDPPLKLALPRSHVPDKQRRRSLLDTEYASAVKAQADARQPGVRFASDKDGYDPKSPHTPVRTRRVATPGLHGSVGDPQQSSSQARVEDVHGPTQYPRGSTRNHSKLVAGLSDLPKFTGETKDWADWDQALRRVAALNNLEQCLEPGYCSDFENFDAHDNKVLFFMIQKAVENSAAAMSFFNTAACPNGSAAYFALHDGFTFNGVTEGAILLQQLASFRFNEGEQVVPFCQRLRKLFGDLARLDGEAAMQFNDTQRLTYLLTAIRHEPELESTHLHIQTEMNRGANNMSFDQAVRELGLRSESARADSILNEGGRARGGQGRRMGFVAGEQTDPAAAILEAALTEQQQGGVSSGTIKTLITSMNHSLRERSGQQATRVCLVDSCKAVHRFPLCAIHHAELVSGKSKSLRLRKGYGVVKYDATDKRVLWPTNVPDADRKPLGRTNQKGGRGRGGGGGRGGRRD